jgi:sulfur carrier protein
VAGAGGTRVILNGEPRELLGDATLEAAVRASGAPSSGRGIAAALDGEVIPRGAWGRTRLRDGQRVEVLQAVQGGSR